jgi:hypothetical protein
MTRRRRPVRIDRDELNTLAGVEFTWGDIGDLVELCTVYRERFCGPPPPDFMLADAPVTKQPPATTEQEARRAFVAAVEAIWRERWQKGGHGSAYRWEREAHDGPLLRLLHKLFEAMGEPNPPSVAALHHDIVAVTNERERPH